MAAQDDFLGMFDNEAGKKSRGFSDGQDAEQTHNGYSEIKDTHPGEQIDERRVLTYTGGLDYSFLKNPNNSKPQDELIGPHSCLVLERGATEETAKDYFNYKRVLIKLMQGDTKTLNEHANSDESEVIRPADLLVHAIFFEKAKLVERIIELGEYYVGKNFLQNPPKFVPYMYEKKEKARSKKENVKKNYSKRPFLFMAISTGHLPTINVLLAAGCDP